MSCWGQLQARKATKRCVVRSLFCATSRAGAATQRAAVATGTAASISGASAPVVGDVRCGAVRGPEGAGIERETDAFLGTLSHRACVFECPASAQVRARARARCRVLLACLSRCPFSIDCAFVCVRVPPLLCVCSMSARARAQQGTPQARHPCPLALHGAVHAGASISDAARADAHAGGIMQVFYTRAIWGSGHSLLPPHRDRPQSIA